MIGHVLSLRVTIEARVAGTRCQDAVRIILSNNSNNRKIVTGKMHYCILHVQLHMFKNHSQLKYFSCTLK